MAIREQGYRHWEGDYSGHAFRWWTIAKASLRTAVYTKGRLTGLLVMLLFAWSMPFFFGLFYFLSGEFGGLERGPDALLRDNLYEMLANWQWMWGVLASAIIGAPLVANDLRSDALYIYLAKPLRRIDYILGKLLACFIWLIPYTIAPALFVYLAASGSTNKLLKLNEPNEILFELLFVYTVFNLLCSICAVAASSLTKRWSFALIAWIAPVFLLFFIGLITAGATRKPEWQYISPRDDLLIFARHVWELTEVEPAWGPATWILFGLIALAGGFFFLRIWRLEVSE